MPSPESTDGADARNALAALEPDQWQHSVETAGLSAPAEITDDARQSLANLFNQLDGHLSAIQKPVRQALQAVLNAIAGQTFGSLQANQAVARGVQDLLNRLGLRLVCPKVGCGQPASLRCAAAGNSKSGVFQFDHSAGRKRTTHKGSSTFPQVTLTDAPADRRRADRAS
jgi:hypothetical protein